MNILKEIYPNHTIISNKEQLITVGCCKILNKYQKYFNKKKSQLAVNFKDSDMEEFAVCQKHFNFNDQIYIPQIVCLKKIIKYDKLDFWDLTQLFYLSGWRHLINNKDLLGKVYNDDDTEDMYVREVYDEYVEILKGYVKKNIVNDDKIKKFKNDFYEALDNFLY
jgi:hypothetical protein